MPGTSDERHAFFEHACKAMTGSHDFENIEALSNFLDDPSCSFLRACVTEQSPGKVTLSNAAALEQRIENATTEILFMKRVPCVLSPATLSKDVQISAPGSSSVVESLHSSLNAIYCPRLLGDQSGAVLPRKLQGLLQDLKTEVGDLVRSGEGGGSLESFSGIQSPLDEVAFWSNFSGRGIDSELVRSSFYLH